MKQHFKKYLKHSCLSGLLFTLLGIGTAGIAVGAPTCHGELAKPSCESMAFIVSIKKDACTEYYETTSGGVSQQCKKNETAHNKCIANPKKMCKKPKSE
ncbi:MAG TPA: hypothetical protein VKR58_04245 [Aquella sp.]|nr:hypothetical protein [Aquella sp.]